MISDISIGEAHEYATIYHMSQLSVIANLLVFQSTQLTMLADGRILGIAFGGKTKEKEKVMINLAALTVDALTDCNVVFN